MKKIQLLLCSCLFLSCTYSKGQTEKTIERELLVDYKKFINLDRGNADLLASADSLFQSKLIDYTDNFPKTIKFAFDSLKKAGVSIATSADGLFRIYSWDNEQGGTMYDYDALIQYQFGTTVRSRNYGPTAEGDPGSLYPKIYTLSANNKVYYLVTLYYHGSAKDRQEAIKVFSIENQNINDSVRLIKTHSGMHNTLSCNFDIFASKIDHELYYDEATKTIFIPLVNGNYGITDKWIKYHFTGSYFEKVEE
jgi:hypothetical protein